MPVPHLSENLLVNEHTEVQHWNGGFLASFSPPNVRIDMISAMNIQYAVADIGKNPVSTHQIQLECGKCAGLRWTGRPNPSRETKFSGANEHREKNVFPC